MYSTLEKTIFLKSVDLFGRIPAGTLSRIAQVTQEKRWPAGAPIFRDGDRGNSMFIVVDGAVEIHKGGRELAILKRGGCFGEMSLLDASARWQTLPPARTAPCSRSTMRASMRC